MTRRYGDADSRRLIRSWGQLSLPHDCGAEGFDGYPAPSPGAGGWKAMERGVDGFGRTSAENRPKVPDA